MASFIGLDIAFLAIWAFANKKIVSASATQLSRSSRVSLFAGSTIWLICVADPLAKLSSQNFSAHAMTQLTVMMVAAPLLVLGLRHSPGPTNPIFIRLTHPVISWAIFVTVLITIYLPNYVGWAIQNPLLARLVVAIILPAVSALYFWPILQISASNFPYALRIMSLFFMMIPETMIGFFIYIQNRVVYDDILTGATTTDLLSQQQLGGALMWSLSMVVDSVWIALAVRVWFDSEKRKGEIITQEILNEQNSN